MLWSQGANKKETKHADLERQTSHRWVWKFGISTASQAKIRSIWNRSDHDLQNLVSKLTCNNTDWDTKTIQNKIYPTPALWKQPEPVTGHDYRETLEERRERILSIYWFPHRVLTLRMTLNQNFFTSNIQYCTTLLGYYQTKIMVFHTREP